MKKQHLPKERFTFEVNRKITYKLLSSIGTSIFIVFLGIFINLNKSQNNLVLADSRPKMFGGTGGVYDKDQCDIGFMTGISGRSAKYLDRVGIICGDLYTPKDTDWFGLEYGGRGGTQFSSSCPEGYAVTGIRGRAAKYIDRIGLICAPINRLDQLWYGLPQFGGRGGSEFETYCPPGEAAIGFQLKHYKYVDAVGLICDDITSRR